MNRTANIGQWIVFLLCIVLLILPFFLWHAENQMIQEAYEAAKSKLGGL